MMTNGRIPTAANVTTSTVQAAISAIASLVFVMSAH